MSFYWSTAFPRALSEGPLKVIFEIPTFYVFSLAVTALARSAGLTNGIMDLLGTC